MKRAVLSIVFGLLAILVIIEVVRPKPDESNALGTWVHRRSGGMIIVHEVQTAYSPIDGEPYDLIIWSPHPLIGKEEFANSSFARDTLERAYRKVRDP